MTRGSEAAAPSRPLPVQVAIFVVLAAVSLGLGLSASGSLLHGLAGYPWPLRAADAVFGTIGYIALWWRRRYPLAFAGYVIVVGIFSTLIGVLGFVAAFTVATCRNWPTSLICSALVAASSWPSLVLYNTDHGGLRVLMALIVIVTFALTGWGQYIRVHRQLLDSLRGRARRAEESREQHAAHARIAERQRMAREMQGHAAGRHRQRRAFRRRRARSPVTSRYPPAARPPPAHRGA